MVIKDGGVGTVRLGGLWGGMVWARLVVILVVVSGGRVFAQGTAQDTSGMVMGRVTDGGGALVPKAQALARFLASRPA